MIETLISVFLASCVYFVVIESIFSRNSNREKAKSMALKSTGVFFIFGVISSLYGWLGFLVGGVILALLIYFDRKIKRGAE